ncbi:MAG: hypothetical protein PUI48_05610 [Oscillospiraceae bacterium]|nr:hypothetical protein [Oscillospiraceae bacterium]MDY6208536.1 hypothetical protein [Oscillospiraceae bacterium]
MNIKTITTVDGVNVVDFGSAASRFYWIENLGSTTVYVSGNENIVPDGDNVKVLSAGCSTMVENLGGKVYILGAGKFQITNQGDKFPPFRNAPVADGGVMASGNPVQIDGLQGGVPFSEMVVSGKNLITYPYTESTKTVNGITFTDNGDGTITANGTATANATFFLARNFGFENEGKYFLSGCPSGGGNNSFYINWYQNHTGVTQKNYNDYGSGRIIPYQHIFSENNSLAIVIIAGATVDNLVFRPQLELGSTPTEYEPPITGRQLTVNVNGTDYTITPDSNPYTVPNDIRQVDGLNNISVSEGELSVTGVRKNAAVKKIWDKIDELTTAIIVSNGETIE